VAGGQNYLFSSPLNAESLFDGIVIINPLATAHRVEFKHIASGLWQTDKRPFFHNEWQHHSYVLRRAHRGIRAPQATLRNR
jgi:hypothetical protein